LLWSEGRISSEYRQRVHPRHDLLGSAVVGGSNNVQTWRNMLELHDVPWLLDHKLRDSIVFPAAAYIAMVTEGFRQIMISRNTEFTSVVLRVIKFLSMFTFGDDDAITELFTELCPVQNSLIHPSEDKFCFTVSSFAATKSTVHCRGMIEMGKDGRDDCGFRPWAPVDRASTITKTAWYNASRKECLSFGPAFQLLLDIKHAHDNSVMEVLSTCHPAPSSHLPSHIRYIPP
jgi:acyl transferase domain-containing protein